MYGLVNNVLKKMIIEKYGDEKWVHIDELLPISDFKHFQQYDDNLTESIIVNLSEISGNKAEDILEEFGIYWVPYAKESEYKSILNIFLTSPIELIKSLDSLHSRLSMTFLDLKPPSFWISDLTEKNVQIHYFSERQLPLEYFVVGLIKGIFITFAQTCQVEIVQFRDGEKEAIFKVEFMR